MIKDVLIIAGPSAVGKTTVADILVARGGFSYVRSVTTRARRGDGRDDEYLYVSREEFLEYIEKGRVLEHTEFGGNFYGTPASEIERIHGEGKTPVLVLDINGVKSIKRLARDFRAYGVYVYDELDKIEKRLLERDGNNLTEDKLKAIEFRKRRNVDEFLSLEKENFDTFDAIVENDTPDSCANKILRHLKDGPMPENEKMLVAKALKTEAESKI